MTTRQILIAINVVLFFACAYGIYSALADIEQRLIEESRV